MLQPESAGGGWRWGALFGRGTPPPEPVASDEAVQGYARLVLELLDRWEELHQHWLAALDDQRRNERLANAAAVYRWQLTGIRTRLEGLAVPGALANWHGALGEALAAAVRGTHLLSHGYRFHNVRTICDGGLLLEEAREQERPVREALASSMQVDATAA